MGSPTTAAVRPLESILSGLVLEADGIYSSGFGGSADQAAEIESRNAFAEAAGGNLLDEVARHHSVAVMDAEVRRFITGLPAGSVVLDVGGGWGWHWRNLRADLHVVILDFARENLRRALRILEPLLGSRVFLVHGDATRLPFPADSFDGYWSVQVLQHIPRFEDAVREAHRVLRDQGAFASYSLGRPLVVELVYRLAGKRFHVDGRQSTGVHLSRASTAHRRLIGRIFGQSVQQRYTEILFHPDLRVNTGKPHSWVARIDARLSGPYPVLACLARQRSFHTQKRALSG